MLKALAKSLKPLLNLSLLTFLVILFFALVGIELFQGDLHGGCYANYISPAGTILLYALSRKQDDPKCSFSFIFPFWFQNGNTIPLQFHKPSVNSGLWMLGSHSGSRIQILLVSDLFHKPMYVGNP